MRGSLWGRFWDNPTLAPEDAALFAAFRDRAAAVLRREEAHLDYGVIHADPVGENILADGDQLRLIDFDDGGHGFRQVDLATALVKTVDAPDHAALRAVLCGGYLSVRALDLRGLDLFLALRAVTYLGWIVPRIDEPGGAEPNRRFTRSARQLVSVWLEGRGGAIGA